MADGGGGERTEGLGDRGTGRVRTPSLRWPCSDRLALVSPPLLGSSRDGTPGLTGSPSHAGRSHHEQRHRPVPGGGDVQGCQLRAPVGGAEVLGAEVDHQKLDQARAALTPRLTLCPRSSADPEDLGQAWGPSRSAHHWNPEGPGRARIPSVGGGDLFSAAGGSWGHGDMGTSPPPGARTPRSWWLCLSASADRQLQI